MSPGGSGERDQAGSPRELFAARAYRIVLLTCGPGNCTFGQMPANSSPKQPSPRQREVLRLLIRGMTNKEIWTRLGISERGVKHHVSGLLMLYQVANRAELIAIVLGRRT